MLEVSCPKCAQVYSVEVAGGGLAGAGTFVIAMYLIPVSLSASHAVGAKG